MDLTPTPKAFEAMKKFTDATCGEAPGPFTRGTDASKRRQARRYCMDFLHHLYALAMKNGAAVAYDEFVKRSVINSKHFRVPEQH